jgi:hypothetical protein
MSKGELGTVVEADGEVKVQGMAAVRATSAGAN